MNTLLSMIKPLNWVHPIIYFLPQDCHIMINSPLPILIGLEMSEEHVFKNTLNNLENAEEKIFVFLDQ